MHRLLTFVLLVYIGILPAWAQLCQAVCLEHERTHAQERAAQERVAGREPGPGADASANERAVAHHHAGLDSAAPAAAHSSHSRLDASRDGVLRADRPLGVETAEKIEQPCTHLPDAWSTVMCAPALQPPALVATTLFAPVASRAAAPGPVAALPPLAVPLVTPLRI